MVNIGIQEICRAWESDHDQLRGRLWKAGSDYRHHQYEQGEYIYIYIYIY